LFCYKWDSISYLMMYYLLLYDYYFRRYKRSNCDMFSLHPCSRCYPLPSAGKDVVLRQNTSLTSVPPHLYPRRTFISVHLSPIFLPHPISMSVSFSYRRAGPISKHINGLETNINYTMGPRRGPKKRTTVLAKASSNLLDWTSPLCSKGNGSFGFPP
jgi:hypothetical protein